MSQYAMQQIIQVIQRMMDRASIGQQNQMLYQTILTNVSNSNTDLSRHLMNYLQHTTQGRWQGGLNENDLANILRPWLNEALNTVARQIAPQGQPGFGGGYQQPGYVPQGGFGGGYVPPYAANITAGLYGEGPAPQPVMQAPVAQAWTPSPADNKASERKFSMDSFDLGRPVNIVLNSADTLQHHPKEGNVVSTDNYKEGAFEDIRISTIDIDLNIAENNADDAARKALRYAPNEVLRGIYANVVSYKEIFHIPMRLTEFQRIAGLIGAEFYANKQRKPDWRNAVKAMGSLTRAEHKIIETALLKFLNPSIFKFLRTSNGDVIEGIEEIDDLKELDDPRSKLKVTQHANYLNVFNELVTRAFDQLIFEENLIQPNDKNFGDFIHCDQIEFWQDDRSKYDYGTYLEKADRLKFIDSMTDRHTVLRIKKNLILTNAIDQRVASNITHFRGGDRVSITTTQNVGCKLLLELDQPKRTEIERVVCMGDNTTGTKTSYLINLGRTLDGHLVLIK